jgi:hypothetical protein
VHALAERPLQALALSTPTLRGAGVHVALVGRVECGAAHLGVHSPVRINDCYIDVVVAEEDRVLTHRAEQRAPCHNVLHSEGVKSRLDCWTPNHTPTVWRGHSVGIAIARPRDRPVVE